MPQQQAASLEITDFPGLVTNIDPSHAKPGSGAVQKNITSAKLAMLETRPGFLLVSFEDQQAGSVIIR